MEATTQGESLQEKLERKATKFFKCLTCMGKPIKEKTHFSGRDPNAPKHKKEKLSSEERAAWISKEIEKSLGGPEVASRLAQQEVQRVKAVQEQVDGAAGRGDSSGAVLPQEYRLDFGSWKGRTIQEVMTNPKGSGYFSALVQQAPRGSEPFYDRPLLKAELVQAGVWDRILAEGLARRKKKATNTLDIEQTGAAQAFHPEARALQNINFKRAAEDLDTPAPLTAVVSVSDEVAPAHRTRATRAATASKARKYLKNCHLCGRYGCETRKCPMRSDMQWLVQEEEQLLTRAVLDPLEMRRRKLIAHLKDRS